MRFPNPIPKTAAALFLLCGGALAAQGATPLLHALLVGGGPDTQNNTAQIEEHLRFVASLVPPSPGKVVLFADGRTSNATLTYTDASRLTSGQQALDVLLPNDDLGVREQTRRPALGVPLDGASQLPAIDHAFARLRARGGTGSSPVLLYFAGHGSQRKKGDQSVYNLWQDGNLDAPTLAHEIDRLPAPAPVILVMAQCFSGGFGTVLFRKADPKLPPTERMLTTFFSAESDRVAAGCGTDTNSPYYQDFSSYFFGALCGRDRLGKPVTGADYDGDGQVSCHEAFCYALIHDASIDTPVCSSMIFLRRYSPMPDAEVYGTKYQALLDGATPAQRAALEALSARLDLAGEGRLLTAYDRLMFSDPVEGAPRLAAYREAQDGLNRVRMETLQWLFAKWPALRWNQTPDYVGAVRAAGAALTKDEARCRAVLEAAEAMDRARAAADDEEALLVRFTGLGEAITRARNLRLHGEATAKARFEKLWKAEQEAIPDLLTRKSPQG